MQTINDQVKQQKQLLQKVLVADDDLPTRKLLRAAVTQWGYEVIEANDGEEAWEILQKPNAPRLLILDWLMPKIDGINLCSRIRQNKNDFYYIILLTQVSGTTNIVKGLEAGADEFLSKPFNMAELRSRLSVGSRIIQYENAFTMEHKKLQNNIAQMVVLSNLLINLSKKIDDIAKICNTDSPINDNSQQAKKIQDLNNNFKQILNVVKDFKSDE